MAQRRTVSQRSELIYELHNFGVNTDTREIFLNPDYNVDNDEAEVDHRMAAALIKNISFLNHQNDHPILIHMCSCGGSWEYGLAIYDAVKSSEAFVYILTYAHARSMSSIILQAGDVRILMPNSYVMIHNGQDGWEGTSKGLITHAKQAQKSTEQMLDIYIERCKGGEYFKSKDKTETQIRSFLKKKMDQNQEWYLYPEDAIKYGFADYIFSYRGCPSLKQILNNE